MTIRYAASTTAAGLLTCAVAVAQAQAQDDSTRTSAQASAQAETSITLVGCLQREADYRRQTDSGRGGVAGTGVGRGNEYVLINASRADAGSSTAAGDCTSTGTGEAYELTGDREPELASYVGRRVQISGTMKAADVEPAPVGTSGSVRPEGGFDPLSQDLRLFELNVTSFSEPTAAPSASSTTQSSGQAVGTSGSTDANAQADVDAGANEALPRTASPLALTGLLGLLSLAGAFGVRLARRF